MELIKKKNTEPFLVSPLMALLFAVLINKRLEKERTNECIFVLTYLFNMCPGKRESFASKNFGNMPSEPPSVNYFNVGNVRIYNFKLSSYVSLSSLQNNPKPSAYVSLQYNILIAKIKSRF